MNWKHKSLRYALCILGVLLLLGALVSACNRQTQAPGPALIGVKIIAARDGDISGTPTVAAKPLRPETDRSLREHAVGWTAAHKAQAKSDPAQCVQCHKPQNCVACHANGVPATHTKGSWVRTHQSAAAKSGAGCDECHTDDYCLACHDSAKPASHTGKWTKTHGKTAAASRTQCAVCHKASYCSSCHGLAMPHPKSWASAHGSAGGNDKLCVRCHTHNECSDCHKTAQPASHGPAWKKSHGEGVKPDSASCTLCHGKDSCNACHGGVAMPHPANFIMEHKNHGASLAANSACFKCHEQKYCGMCHTNN